MTAINANIVSTLITNPQSCIDSFDLKYVHEKDLCIKRKKHGRGFTYFLKDKRVTNEEIKERIKKLVIPPMWKKVRITNLENGHLQAVGRDEKNRKVYLYHEKWNLLRNQTKFFKMYHFGKSLPKIRAKVEADLRKRKWTETKVLALIIKLLEETHIRIGNEQYAKRNKTYGLTTLRTRHLTEDENKMRIEFVGKRGKEHNIEVKDKKLVRLLNQCQEIPGWEVFQYYDEDGQKKSVDSSLVNDYIHTISDDLFTAKDFRTWSASVICFNTLLELGISADEKTTKQNIITAVDKAADELGNTRSVSRSYYIHPKIINSYEDKTIAPFFDKVQKNKSHKENLSPSETVLLELIKDYQPFED